MCPVAEEWGMGTALSAGVPFDVQFTNIQFNNITLCSILHIMHAYNWRDEIKQESKLQNYLS